MDVEAVLKQLIQAEVAAAARRPPAENPTCPSLPRFREVLLDPQRWTESERRHLIDEACPRCLRTLQKFRSQLWHPGLPSLARHVFLGDPTADRHARLHLEQDTCRRCLAVVAFLQHHFDTAARAARGAWDEVERFAENLLLPTEGMLIPTPAAGAVSAQGRDLAPLSLGDDLVLALRYRGSGSDERVMLYVESSLPSRAGQSMRFVFLSQSGEPRLEGSLGFTAAAGRDAVAAEADLGLRTEFERHLGSWRLPVLYPES